jgi:MinD superfamily P-loop ATPase
MKKIAIASGKGGTGKTTFSVNFALYLKKLQKNIILSDLDVEEPNSHLFFSYDKQSVSIFNYIPIHHKDKCTYCGLCAKSCEFNALIAINNYWKLFQEMCHGCKVCEYVCPENAISEGKREIGKIEISTDDNFKLIVGRLNIGETLTSEMIKQTRKFVENKFNDDILIYDCPPGTTCPAINSVLNCDYVILIAEPTPFGFHDFKLMIDVLEKVNIVPLVIINKYEGQSELENFCISKKLKIIGKIPFSKKIAKIYSQAKTFFDDNEFISFFDEIKSELDL